MVERGVALIAVLGGDGTHKAVAAEVGDVLLALSTGTNNAFPELREATGAGLAGGLCASNRVPPEIGLRRNKRLLVRERAAGSASGRWWTSRCRRSRSSAPAPSVAPKTSPKSSSASPNPTPSAFRRFADCGRR